MVSGLVIPPLMVISAVILWCIFYLVRTRWWYKRLDALEAKASKNSGGGGQATPVSDPGDPSLPISHNQIQTPLYGDQNLLPDHLSTPKPAHAAAYSLTVDMSSIPGVDPFATDSLASPASSHQMPTDSKANLNLSKLQKWQLPGAEVVPKDTLWYGEDEEGKKQQDLEEKFSLTLIEKLRVLDDYMPLSHQVTYLYEVMEVWKCVGHPCLSQQPLTLSPLHTLPCF
jgi:hypothetical protein